MGQDLADARLNQSVLEQSNEALERTILYFKQERSALEQSASWRATRRVARLASSIAPPASGRRQTMKRIERLLEITHREGIRAIPRRLWSKAKCGLTDMARLGFGQQTRWVPDGRPVFVLVHRRGGGGTDRHLRELTTGLRTAGVRPVMIAAGPRNMLTWEEPGTAGQRSWTFQGASTRESMTALLEALMPVHAHIHSMMKLPEMLLELLVLRGVTYDWTLHDYYPICPRRTLTAATAGTAASLNRPPVISVWLAWVITGDKLSTNQSRPGASGTPPTCGEPDGSLPLPTMPASGSNATYQAFRWSFVHTPRS